MNEQVIGDGAVGLSAADSAASCDGPERQLRLREGRLGRPAGDGAGDGGTYGDGAYGDGALERTALRDEPEAQPAASARALPAPPDDVSLRRRARRWLARRRPGLAIDLGSSRTRVWVHGRGTILDVRTVTFAGGGATYPVRRGAIVDPEGAAQLLDRVLAHRFPLSRHTAIAVTTPVLDGIAYRETVRAVLEVLRPSSVVTVSTAKAIAAGAGADPARPLLVVDIGAQLTEVFLLVDGEVADAYRTTLGTQDLAPGSCRELVESVATTLTGMLRRDRTPQTFDALRHGVLLAGGGALRPEVTLGLSRRLRVPVRPAPAPHTVAVRGAARRLQSVRSDRPPAELPDAAPQLP